MLFFFLDLERRAEWFSGAEPFLMVTDFLTLAEQYLVNLLLGKQMNSDYNSQLFII
jgi:hypothetical protein